MGSCCGKERGYGAGNAEEPSAWQLATMDDFYDSEVGESHDEHDLVELQPSSVQLQRGTTLQEGDDAPIPDGQIVSLDFNLAPRRSPLHRSSILGASGSSIGSSREHTEALVLPEIRALNDLRGSGSFTISSRTPTHASTSMDSISRASPVLTQDATTQEDEIETALDQTVIVRNSESVFSYTYGDTSTALSDANKTLGGVLSGEDDEDSVAIPLVSSSPSKPSTHDTNARKLPPGSPSLTPAQRRPPPSPSMRTRAQNGGHVNYLPLDDQNDQTDASSTIYEDALDSQAQNGIV